MYYYDSKLPSVGQIVLAHIVTQKETEQCLYVRIPEYNDIEGIIPKADLPKKRRTYNRVLAQMRRDKIIPCVVTKKPVLDRKDDHTSAWAIDLSIKNIELDKREIIISRFNTITRILKALKFLSEELGTTIDRIAYGFWDRHIVELDSAKITDHDDTDDSSDTEDSTDSEDSENSTDSSDSKNTDSKFVLTDLSELYQQIIGDIEFTVSTICSGIARREIEELTEDQIQALRSTLKERVTMKTSDCTIGFNLRVDDADKSDPVTVLRETFTEVLERDDLSIQYNGAPNYTACVKNVHPDDLDDVKTELQTTFTDTLRSKNAVFLFKITDAAAKVPTYTLSYPREIVME